MRRALVRGVWWLLAVAVAACSGSTNSGPATTSTVAAPATAPPTTAPATTTPSTSTSGEATSTTATTAPAHEVVPLLPPPVADVLTLTDPDAPAPSVDLTADTWAELVGVWADIDAYWTWLNAHPNEDPAVLSVIFHPDGPEIDAQSELNADIAEQGLRLVADSALGEVVGFGCCPNPDEEIASGVIKVLVVSRAATPFVSVVDQSGGVTEELPGWNRAEFQFDLRRTGDGEWKIWARD